MLQQDKLSDNYRTCYPHPGKVCWIGLRPGRGQPVEVVEQARATREGGLSGDRFSGKPGADRQVTLIQAEHLDTVARLLERGSVDPALVRRNIVVSGINLTSLKGQRFAIGDVVLLGTGACPPCGQMERNLGPGGFNAMRGHGGITACVIIPGNLAVGDPVRFVDVEATTDSSPSGRGD